jgi:hypothetical protein
LIVLSVGRAAPFNILYIAWYDKPQALATIRILRSCNAFFISSMDSIVFPPKKKNKSLLTIIQVYSILILRPTGETDRA